MIPTFDLHNFLFYQGKSLAKGKRGAGCVIAASSSSSTPVRRLLTYYSDKNKGSNTVQSKIVIARISSQGMRLVHRPITLIFSTPQVEALFSHTKTVTRRIWKQNTITQHMRAFYLNLFVRVWAYKRGNVVGHIRYTNITLDKLSNITQEDCALEGHPHLTPNQFTARFFQNVPLDTSVLVLSFVFFKCSS